MTPQMAARMVLLLINNYSQNLTPEETDMKTELFYSMFYDVPDDKFMTACKLAMLNNPKWFPGVGEIKKAIDELNQELRIEKEQLPELPRGRASEEKVKLVMEMAMAGKTGELLQRMDTTKLLEVAKLYFPNREGIDDDFVRRNVTELMQLMQQETACFNCRRTNYCPMQRYRYIPTIHQNGFIILDRQKCQKDRVTTAAG